MGRWFIHDIIGVAMVDPWHQRCRGEAIAPIDRYCIDLQSSFDDHGGLNLLMQLLRPYGNTLICIACTIPRRIEIHRTHPCLSTSHPSADAWTPRVLALPALRAYGGCRPPSHSRCRQSYRANWRR